MPGLAPGFLREGIVESMGALVRGRASLGLRRGTEVGVRLEDRALPGVPAVVWFMRWVNGLQRTGKGRGCATLRGEVSKRETRYIGLFRRGGEGLERVVGSGLCFVCTPQGFSSFWCNNTSEIRKIH